MGILQPVPNPRALPPSSSRMAALLASGVALLLVLGSVPASGAPVSRPVGQVASAAASASAPVVIATGDRQAVAAAYRDRFLPAMAVAAPEADPAAVAACDAGLTPAPLQAATLELVNYFRAMSGVQPVTFDTALSAKAQQAALMMDANNALSHTPPASWTCNSAPGAEAAAASNLALGYRGADVIKGYMDDPGAGNEVAGHRWWLQRPSTRTMGSGYVGRAQALWVNDGDTAAGTPTYTSWPSAGFFPGQLEPVGRWSFTATDPAYDLGSATVTVVDGRGNPVPARALPVGAFGSLVFELGSLPAPGAAFNDYRVTVSNILVGGTPIDPYAYTVSIFDPTYVAPPTAITATTPATISGLARIGSTLVARAPTWSTPSVSTTYRWLRNGTSIAGQTSDRLQLGTADLGTRISLQATGSKTGFLPGTSRSAQTAAVAKIPATLALTGRSMSYGDLQIGVTITAEPGLGGSVAIIEGTKTIAAAIKVVDGRAAFRASKVKPGSHTYTVRYSGTSRVSGPSGVVRVVVRDKARPTLTLAASSPAVGKVKIIIRVAAAGEGALTGVATVQEGSRSLARLTVTNSQAVFQASKIKPGRHTYTVGYGGTSRVAAVRGTVVATVKAKTASSTSLTGTSPAPNTIKIDIAVRATGQPPLGGTANVLEGTKTVKSGLKLIGGRASYSAGGVTSGNHTYTVKYSGTSEVNGSARTVTIAVKKPVALKSYDNCTAMRVDHPHGVGRIGAKDKASSGDPVTDFLRNNALYALNDGGTTGQKDLDRDNDFIACESH